ncbi:MAG TPA: O-antigen ligase family protein [Stellaceae bacterium]|nr:O-antigen ligase family protein [Stellaceae bacterium]
MNDTLTPMRRQGEDRADETRPRPRERAVNLAFGAVGPVAYLAPLGLAVLLPALGIALFFAMPRERRPSILAALARMRLLWLLPVIAILSALWAVAPGAALFEGGRLLGEIAIGAGVIALAAQLPQARRQEAVLALAAGLGAAAAVMLADTAMGGDLTAWARRREITDITLANAYSRGAIVHALLLPPLLVALLRSGRRLAAGLSLLAATAAIGVLHSASAKLALPAGLAAALATYLWLGFGRVLVLLQCALVLALPFLLIPMPDPASFCDLAEYQSSGLHRLYIWRFVDWHILERPLLGWGMDASRRLAGPEDKVTLYRCATAEHPRQAMGTVGLLPLHPHDAALQIWVELGAVGALAAALALATLFLPLFAPGRPAAPAAAGGLAAVTIAASISFGIWQSWWIASFFLCAALATLAGVGEAARPETVPFPRAAAARLAESSGADPDEPGRAVGKSGTLH